MAAFRDSGATRTPDPQLRRLLLYPTELRNLITAAKLHYFSFDTSETSPHPLQLLFIHIFSDSLKKHSLC